MIFGSLASIVGIASAGQQNVSLGGHTFTADLPDGWKVNQSAVEPFNNPNPKDIWEKWNNLLLGAKNATDWIGFQDTDISRSNVLILNPGYNKSDFGWADIFVLKPTQEYLMTNRIKSSDSMILKHATDSFFDCDTLVFAKDIDFNGKPAHLVLGETGTKYRIGTIAFFLDDGSVAVIDVTTGKDLGSSPWDIINSMTVT